MKNITSLSSLLKVYSLWLALLFFSVGQVSFGQQSYDATDPENVIRELYDQVTFPVGETPDWDKVRTMFLKEATVTMPFGRDSTATLSLDGWILDFVNFINNANVKAVGFEEKIIKMESVVFGDIAHIWVLYTSFLPGRSKAPREGIDAFHLIKKKGNWYIVSILNEIPGPTRSKPDFFKN